MIGHALLLLVLWYSPDLISQRLGAQIPAVMEEFFNFKKLLVQIANWQ